MKIPHFNFIKSNKFYFAMSSNHYPSRSHFNTLIRSNHCEIHGSNCHCIEHPITTRINNTTSNHLKK